MFGHWHYLKDIKIITTDNAIKWKKFKDLMGGSLESAYEYWCNKVNEDGSVENLGEKYGKQSPTS